MPPTNKPRAAETQGAVLPLFEPNKLYTPKERPGPKRILIAEKELTFP